MIYNLTAVERTVLCLLSQSTQALDKTRKPERFGKDISVDR
jgi:hypothetical protein